MLKRNHDLIIENIRKKMDEQEIDALVVTSRENFYYASGFLSIFLYVKQVAGLVFLIIPRTGKPVLIVNEFEAQNALTFTDNIEILTYPTWIYVEDPNGLYLKEQFSKDKPVQFDLLTSFSKAVEVLQNINYTYKRIGVEQSTYRQNSFEIIKGSFKEHNFVEATNLFVDVRSIKHSWEIDTIKRGTEITEEAMIEVKTNLRPGMTETDIKYLFNQSIYRSANVFTSFLVTGLGKLFSPSLYNRDYIIQKGDFIKLDGGANIDGYNSDIARTWVLGKPTEQQNNTYRALVEGYKKALSLMKPGVRLGDLFTEAQQAIRDNGLVDYNRGHLGHTIGLGADGFLEEPPFIAPNETKKITPGMVFCLEMPYYSAEIGAINIEDTLVITDDGFVKFSNIETDLISL